MKSDTNSSTNTEPDCTSAWLLRINSFVRAVLRRVMVTGGRIVFGAGDHRQWSLTIPDPFSSGRTLRLCVVLLVVAVGVIPLAVGAPLGASNLLSGTATFFEGTYRRVAYSPGSDQSIVIEGSWAAILADNGVQISVERSSGEIRTVALVGDDQFELVTKKDGFQEAEVRDRSEGTATGPNVIIAQYLLERLTRTSLHQAGSAPSYGRSWYHLINSLAADTTNGVSVRRSNVDGKLLDRWYVSKSIAGKGGDIPSASYPVPGYGPDGFLAADVTVSDGDVGKNDRFSVNEYWPKRSLDAGEVRGTEDVDLFRETHVSVIKADAVWNQNLLPNVTYKKASIADYRFQKQALTEPLRMSFEKTYWILRGSKAWVDMEGAAARAAVIKSPSLARQRAVRKRVLQIALVFALPVPVAILAKRRFR